MSYTIGDWIRDTALVQVRLPSPQGGIRAWLPLAVLTGNGGPMPDYFDYRTSTGHELIDFLQWSEAHRSEQEGGATDATNGA